MNVNPDHPVNHPEPLPGDFDIDARRVDKLLGAQARRTAVPMGLSDRVYQASVKLLPKSRQPAMRLVGTAAEVQRRHLVFTLHRTAWGRAALAASVAIVCTVAWMMLQTAPSPQPERLLVAVIDGSSSSAVSALGFNGDMLPAGSLDQLDSDMAYLLNTGSLTSMNEVHQELAVLVAALEM